MNRFYIQTIPGKFMNSMNVTVTNVKPKRRLGKFPRFLARARESTCARKRQIYSSRSYLARLCRNRAFSLDSLRFKTSPLPSSLDKGNS